MEASEKQYASLTAAIAGLVAHQDLPATEDFRLMMKNIQNYQLQNTMTHLRSAKLHQSLISHNIQLQKMISNGKISSKTGKEMIYNKIIMELSYPGPNPENG